MGGSGGGWAPQPPTGGGAGLDTTVLRAASASAYDAEANGCLQELLADGNRRDVDAIRRRLETLQQAIERDIEGTTTTLFGGSVRKHTYVDGLSDVDVLIVINASELANASPAQVLAYFAKRISERLGSSGVKVEAGTLAVTVRYADGTEIQVLPALRTATGIRIASPQGGWSPVVRPQEFAKKLTAVNQAQSGRVVPVIKLFKSLQTQLPLNNQLTGYHIESLAIEAFRGYAGRRTLKDMLHHLVAYASQGVQRPILDRTGQSLHVDDYLGAAGSTDRQRVAGALTRLVGKLKAAEQRGSVDDLKSAFGE